MATQSVFTNTIDKGLRVWKLGDGLLATITELTCPQSSGSDFPIDIETNKAKLGFRKIFTVIGLSATNAAGTMLADKIYFTYNSVAGTLYAWKSGGNALVADGGTNIDAGGKVRILVLGV